MLQRARTVLPPILGLGVACLVGLTTTASADDATRPQKLAPPSNLAKQVDKLMMSTWKAAKLKPRKQATDAEWLRRATLDLTGTIPSEESVRKFLANKKSGKRADKIQELLKSEAWAREQALKWSQLMVGRTYLSRTKNYKRAMKMQKMREKMMGGGKADDDMYVGEDVLSLDEWLAGEMHGDAAWNEIATQLITAEGTVDKKPAGHYMLRYARDGKAAEMTGSVMRVFQGLQVQCSQCHDDPYDRWSQRDFWGLAAFFSRTNARRTAPLPGARKRPNGQRVPGPFRVFDRGMGQARMPADQGEVGALVLPKFITGDVINPGPSTNRRAEVAKLITGDDNPYFAKATVNRVWSHYFGRGIVNPVDELTEEDYPHPDVLSLLEDDFKKSGYDMRRLTEIITNTRAYGITSAGPEDEREVELALFARAPLRSLSAEQLFYSVLEATGVEDLAQQDNRRQRRRLERMKYGLLQKFVRTFGDDDEGEEVVEQGTIPEALMLLNGPLTNDAVRPRPGHPVYDRLFAMSKVERQINTIYMRVLSRPATRAERNSVKKYLQATKGQGPTARARAYADVFWALLNSSEFNLIH